MKMLKSLILIAAASTAGMSAVASEASDPPWVKPAYADVGTPKTRAEVRAELQAAIANGTLPPRGEAGYTFETVPSTKSRAQVRAELAEARRLGLVQHGEASPVFPTFDQTRRIAVAGQLAALGTTAAATAR